MRKLIAGALLALALVGCQADAGYDRTCRTSAEDASTAHCRFDPEARYDYDRGAWRQVPDAMVYANGNRPPTGAYLTAHPTP